MKKERVWWGVGIVFLSLACCYIRILDNNALIKDDCGNGKHWEGNDDRTDRDEQASVRMAKGKVKGVNFDQTYVEKIGNGRNIYEHSGFYGVTQLETSDLIFVVILIGLIKAHMLP